MSARRLYEDRHGRLGECKVCGDPVLWFNTRWGARVPLDPVPVCDIGELLPSGDFYISNGGTAFPISQADAYVYRLHNDGECIRTLRAEEEAARSNQGPQVTRELLGGAE